MTLLTIFSAPKPFTNPHIALIQRNAIQSWVNLGPEVDVLLVGDEPGIGNFAYQLGARHLVDVERNSRGTPLVSSMFELARRESQSPLLACINADMITLPDFLQAGKDVMRQLKEFLIVGRRWDLAVTQPIDFSEGWDERLRQQVAQSGRLHAASGSDYFIFPRECFTDMPDFAVGRPGWDNWTIYSARRHGWQLVDAYPTVTIIHQDHDYSHLPGGRPPYGGPEAGENLQQAGGSNRTIFFPHDGNWVLDGSHLRRPPLTWKRFWREVEILPIVKWGSPFLAQLFFSIMHPSQAYFEFRRGNKLRWS